MKCIFSLFSFIILTLSAKGFVRDTLSCPFILGESKELLLSGKDDFSHPKISPDGKKVIVTKEGYCGIYLIDISNPRLITTISNKEKTGFNVQWSENGNEVLFYMADMGDGGKMLNKRYRYSLLNKNISLSLSSNLKKSNQDVIVSFNIKKKVVEATDGVKVWNITKEKGVYYDIVLSPDKTKVLLHKNDGQMYVYNIDGTGSYCLGRGLCQSWSPDSKYLLYFISNSKGNDYIVESDIYISTFDGKNKWKLTNTSNQIEKWPDWSKDGKSIVYYEQNAKKIFLAKIISN